ncbi:hypothetical protein ACOMHN_061720 [Nucella lapillus]
MALSGRLGRQQAVWLWADGDYLYLHTSLAVDGRRLPIPAHQSGCGRTVTTYTCTPVWLWADGDYLYLHTSLAVDGR